MTTAAEETTQRAVVVCGGRKGRVSACALVLEEAGFRVVRSSDPTTVQDLAVREEASAAIYLHVPGQHPTELLFADGRPEVVSIVLAERDEQDLARDCFEAGFAYFATWAGFPESLLDRLGHLAKGPLSSVQTLVDPATRLLTPSGLEQLLADLSWQPHAGGALVGLGWIEVCGPQDQDLEALVEALADRTQSLLRASDHLGRLGPRALGVLLPRTSGEGPSQVLRRIAPALHRPLPLGSTLVHPELRFATEVVRWDGAGRSSAVVSVLKSSPRPLESFDIAEARSTARSGEGDDSESRGGTVHTLRPRK